MIAIPRPAGYRRLLVAHTISRAGDTFNVVALAILVFRISGNGLGVSGLVVAEILPVLLIGPLAGIVADRLPRRRIMVVADLARAGLAAALFLAGHDLVAVYAVAFGLAGGSVFFNPASSSLLPDLVMADELRAANSGLWSAAVAVQIAVAPLAGLLVAAVGVGPAFGINALSFMLSAGVLVGLEGGELPNGGGVPGAEPSPPPRHRPSVRRQVGEGLQALTGDPVLRLLAVTQTLAALSAGATSALLVVLARRRLGVGPEGFGLLLAAIGVGAVIGPLVLARAGSDPRRRGWVFAPYLLRGAVDLVLAASRSVAVALPALGVYGMGTSTGMVTFNSLVQAEAPEDVRGRVFAGFDVLWQVGRLLSLAAGGVAADAFGIAAVYAFGGALMLAAGAYGFWGDARVRRPA